jgi:hypothetical protein
VSKTFIIGLDLDGVVYDWDRTARYMLRRRAEGRGEIPSKELSVPARNWTWIKDHTPKQDYDWLWSEEGIRSGQYRYGNIVTGAIEGVQALSEIGDVIAITARPKAAVNDTLTWLATFFDKTPLAGLVIQSHGQKKSDVKPTPNVYIDDGTHNLKDVLENTNSFAVQFYQPWNSGWVPDTEALAQRWGVAVGWREAVNWIRGIKEGRLVHQR